MAQLSTRRTDETPARAVPGVPGRRVLGVGVSILLGVLVVAGLGTETGRALFAAGASYAEDLGAWVTGDRAPSPWVVPARMASPELRTRVEEMGRAYRQTLSAVPLDSRRTRVPRLPGDRHAPPRMDSGDPNPDRLNHPGLAFSPHWAGQVPE